jgi:hypothetical protein
MILNNLNKPKIFLQKRLFADYHTKENQLNLYLENKQQTTATTSDRG